MELACHPRHSESTMVLGQHWQKKKKKKKSLQDPITMEKARHMSSIPLKWEVYNRRMVVQARNKALSLY
jgi:hypothetical protein